VPDPKSISAESLGVSQNLVMLRHVASAARSQSVSVALSRKSLGEIMELTTPCAPTLEGPYRTGSYDNSWGAERWWISPLTERGES